MKAYELTLILDPRLKENQLKTLQENLEKSLTEAKIEAPRAKSPRNLRSVPPKAGFSLRSKRKSAEVKYSSVPEMLSIPQNAGISQRRIKLSKKEDWGVKNLAYPIAKNREGRYLFYSFQAQPAIVAELRKKFKLEEKILRYLIIRKD